MPAPRFMLDTNTASYIIKGQPAAVRAHLCQVPMANVCISATTEAELLRGVAKNAQAKQLAVAVNAFLIRVDILAWDTAAARAYATLKTACEQEGKSLGAMDMFIAAHSVAANRILVTNDHAFYHLQHLLKLQDWTKPVADQ